jgi:hypothetical protein
MHAESHPHDGRPLNRQLMIEGLHASSDLQQAGEGVTGIGPRCGWGCDA